MGGTLRGPMDRRFKKQPMPFKVADIDLVTEETTLEELLREEKAQRPKPPPMPPLLDSESDEG